MWTRKERAGVLQGFRAYSSPQDLDVIDKGDHLKVTSCSCETAAWWLGTLRAAYPQDHCSGDDDHIKMHPEVGVTLTLNKADGTLRIKGKKHMQWFQDNFQKIVDSGSKEYATIAELHSVIDTYMRITDGYTVSDLLANLPASGAFKHGPSYIYRLWRGLLNEWTRTASDVYVVSPILDARRVADILLMLIKHKSSRSRVHLFTLHRCDGDHKFSRVFRDAREMLKSLKGPNRNKLFTDERVKFAAQRLDAKFGRFHCKMLAMCGGGGGGGSGEGSAEVLHTSASFHKWHFEVDNGDVAVHLKMSTEDLIKNYVVPLGMVHQPLDETAAELAGSRSPHTPEWRYTSQRSIVSGRSAACDRTTPSTSSS